MIVKDEEIIIERAFESLKHVFDSYVICDTGSTDNTVNVIKEWMNTNNKEGEIIFKEWVNFGFNKSYLWEYFRNNKKSEYVIFLDADEVFITNPNDNKSYLSIEDTKRLYNELEKEKIVSIFYLDTLYGNLTYQRWQICRNNQLYVWKQPVHEYLHGSTDNVSKRINWIYNHARKEGNSSRNPDRYEKDAEMFLEFLKENPNDSRATFYIAQTYESCCKNMAIEYYKKRIDLETGWDQEKYIACLRLGRIVDNIDDKIKYWLLGTTFSSERLECYYELMMYYYNKQDHNKAFGIGSMVSVNREHHPSFLFVDNKIYNYLFDLHFAVSCYYSKNYLKGLEANKRAFVKAPENIKSLITSNLKFFEDKDKHKDKEDKIFKVKNDSDKLSLIIVDDFYENPMEIRNMILNDVPFEVKGNYPGFRTKCLFDKKEFSNMKERFENIIGKKIIYWPKDYNSSFQYATEEMASWIHRDNTEWSAVVYMTPNAPCNGGTNIYRHKILKIESDVEGGESEIKQMNDESRNYDNWELMDSVGNKFNRCILFKGKRSHKSGEYFGTNKETSRLFQTFFFNT